MGPHRPRESGHIQEQSTLVGTTHKRQRREI